MRSRAVVWLESDKLGQVKEGKDDDLVCGTTLDWTGSLFTLTMSFVDSMLSRSYQAKFHHLKIGADLECVQDELRVERAVPHPRRWVEYHTVKMYSTTTCIWAGRNSELDWKSKIRFTDIVCVLVHVICRAI